MSRKKKPVVDVVAMLEAVAANLVQTIRIASPSLEDKRYYRQLLLTEEMANQLLLAIRTEYGFSEPRVNGTSQLGPVEIVEAERP